MDHSSGFLKVVNDAKSRVEQIDIPEAQRRLETRPGTLLVDVREDSEWQAGHAAGAIHLGKGVLERDIEKLFPSPETELIFYCGGGFRSALAADMAQKMGYRRVSSLDGGYKLMKEQGWPMA